MIKKHKKIFGLITTILVGLLGSALWELLFSPITHKFLDFLMSLPNSISATFSSHYVQTISSATDQFLIIDIRSFLFMIIFLSFIFDMVKHDKAYKTHFTYMKLMFFIILFCNTMYDISAYHNSHRLRTDIEILAPYISDLDYKLLKSDFYSMNSKDDYDAFTKRLNSLADLHNIELKY